jgi:uncharacterized coiled-coil DUF342 family protein
MSQVIRLKTHGQLQNEIVELIEEVKALKKVRRGLSHKLTGLRKEVKTVLTHTEQHRMVTSSVAYQELTERLARLVKHE